MGPARALYVGPSLGLAPHFNLATTLAVSLDGTMELRLCDAAGRWSGWQAHAAVQIPSQCLHHLRASGRLAVLYVDPLGDGRAPLPAQALQQGRDRLLAAGPGIGLADACAGFGLAPRPQADGRIVAALRALDAQPQDFARVADVAALAGLSPSRFQALLRAATGLPFRRYRQWRRMARVMHCLAAGSSLTEAAHAAGFASSAHLSSSFRRHFGIPASQLLATGVQIDLSDDA